MLEFESLLLSQVHFPLKPRQINSLLGAQGSESNNFSPLSWYTDKPCEEDQLFDIVKYLYDEIANSLNHFLEENNIEKKENAGQSTQYLLLIPDEDRALFTID